MTEGPGLESTAALLVLARQGDGRALDRLAERYRLLLLRWAHGRIPASARTTVETADLVQSTLMNAFRRIDRFEDRHEGAFLAYLRQILLNKIRDHAKRERRRPRHEEIHEDLVDSGARSPLDEMIGKEGVARYEEALAALPGRHREAIILRMELGLRYREVAEALGAPSVNAARLLVARSLVRLAAAIRDDGQTEGKELMP